MNRTFRWYYKERNILILLVVCFPFGIYLMFKYTQWNPRFKLAVTGFYSIITLTILVFLGVWIFSLDQSGVNTNIEAKYNCQEATNNSCLIEAVLTDLEYLGNEDNLDVIPHQSITIKYPETTLEITKTQTTSINSYETYRSMAMEMIKVLNMDELEELGYVHLDISYIGTYYQNDIPTTEILLTYRFNINDYLGNSWEKEGNTIFDNNIIYNNDMFDEDIN
jgi:hypothetical protein